MAFQPVQVVGPQDKVKSTGSRKGGGKFGAAVLGTVGAVAGGMAGMATGGPAGAVVGSIGGAAGGASLGNSLGEMIKPSRDGSTAIERRLQSQGPQMVQSETSNKLRDSLMALHEAPQQAKQQYAQPLLSAYMQSVAKDNQRA